MGGSAKEGWAQKLEKDFMEGNQQCEKEKYVGKLPKAYLAKEKGYKKRDSMLRIQEFLEKESPSGQ